MTEWVEQWVCIRFCIKLEHCVESGSEGHSCGQLVTDSFIVTICLLIRHVLGRIFWQKIKSLGWLRPPQSRFGALRLLAFSKTKITFEREEISDYGWDSGKYNRAADGNWENCVRSQGTYLEGDRGVIVLCTFLVSYIFFNKCLYFSYYMAGYLLDRPYLYIYLLNLILWHLSIDQIACKYHYMKLSTRYMQSFLLWLEKLP